MEIKRTIASYSYQIANIAIFLLVINGIAANINVMASRYLSIIVVIGYCLHILWGKDRENK